MPDDKSKAEQIAKDWLNSVIKTVEDKNLNAHLDLISRKVSLTGVPGFESIGYEDWASQCKHEFENNLIKKIAYSGFKLRVNTNNSIMFKTYETVEAADNTVNAQGIEVIIEKEQDGQWRVIQERIMPDDETKHEQLLNP